MEPPKRNLRIHKAAKLETQQGQPSFKAVHKRCHHTEIFGERLVYVLNKTREWILFGHGWMLSAVANLWLRYFLAPLFSLMIWGHSDSSWASAASGTYNMTLQMRGCSSLKSAEISHSSDRGMEQRKMKMHRVRSSSQDHWSWTDECKAGVDCGIDRDGRNLIVFEKETA